MKTNKNIDELFQENLKNFEVSPPNMVWENIKRNLKTNKPKSLLPLWLRYGSVAVILVLLTVGGVNYLDESPEIKDSDNTIITNSDNTSNPEIDINFLEKDILNSSEGNKTIIAETNENREKNILSEPITSNKKQIGIEVSNNKRNNIEHNNATIQSKKLESNLNTKIATNNNSFNQETSLPKTNQIENANQDYFKTNEENTTNSIAKTTVTPNFISDSKKEFPNNYSTLSQSDRIVQNNAKETDVNNLKNKSDDVKDNLEKVSDKVEDVVAQTENKEEKSFEEILTENIGKETEESTKKWSVASVFAPIYYNSFNANSSPIDLQFQNNPKQGSKTMSYGVKIGYKINKKLSLQSGVTLVNVGYKIGDVFISPSQQGLQRLTNVNYSSAANILNVNVGNFLNNIQLETTSAVPIKGVLNQEFGYIEVPLELKYKLNNSQKLGVNIVGGFSTLFLNKNEVYVETSEFSSNLGEANNLNTINFSGNIGIDIDYKINKNLYLNVAPMLKIHTSTFSKNADNFKPYIFGVYTGLNYKF